MNENVMLNLVNEHVYAPCSFLISNLEIEKEGKDYNACKFLLNDRLIICRNAKITPKKIGQFVTCWRRNASGITEPYSDKEEFNFYVINVQNGSRIGQFVFPKSALIDHGIISSTNKDGKRGFRVYPHWDIPNSKQAEKTQKWQLQYFIEFGKGLDLNIVKHLYNKK